VADDALHLIPFTPQHFGVLASWFSNERDVVQWGGPAVSYPLNDRQMQAMVDEGSGPGPRRLCWMATIEGNIVGHGQLGFDWRNGVARLGRVAVAPSARGHGLALPMLRLVVDQAFTFEGVERVDLYVYAWNAAAIRTYERLGFLHEGTQRSLVRVGSERWDTTVMAMLRAEWSVTAHVR
jgi:RimJ/RimL family protein N-acetyltransferase